MKLTKENIVEIKFILELTNFSYEKIGKEYNVTGSYIGKIAKKLNLQKANRRLKQLGLSTK